jgi:uncharacterized membrane protein
MKRSTKVITTVVLSIGVVTAGVAGYGYHHFGDPQKRAEWMMERLENKLELNADQTAILQSLADQLLAVRSDFTQDRDAKKDQLLTLVSADTLDQQTLLDMVTEKTQNVEQQAPAIIAAIADFTDSLDAQQRTELVEMLEWRFSDWHH